MTGPNPDAVVVADGTPRPFDQGEDLRQVVGVEVLGDVRPERLHRVPQHHVLEPAVITDSADTNSRNSDE